MKGLVVAVNGTGRSGTDTIYVDDIQQGYATWTNEPSVVLKSSVSDADSSDTDQLCAEVKAIATSFDGTGETCGTGAAYSGTPVTASVTISGLSNGTQYHWRVRTKDAGGLYSSWVSYGSNSESTVDFGVDTSAPTTATVYDGNSTGVDKSFNDGSLSSLSANWDAFGDSSAGVVLYQYSITTAPNGGTTVLGWTDNDTTRSVTATGLTLHTGQIYFFNVRAVDGAGNTSAVVSSNGQLVAPTLTFVVGNTNIDLGNLNANNSYTATASTTMTTSTNAYAGYMIHAFESSRPTSGANTIAEFSGGTYASPDAWQSGETGFGYPTNDNLVNGSNRYQASTCPGGNAFAAPGCYAPFTLSGPGDVIADHTAAVTGTPITNEVFNLYLQTTVPSTQAAGTYRNFLVISCAAIY